MMECTGVHYRSNAFLERITSRWQSNPTEVFAIYHDSGRESIVTLEMMRRRSLKFLTVIQQAGAVEGDLVLLILQHGLDAHSAFVGAMLGGCVPSFLPFPSSKLDHRLFWDQHRKLFESCGARLAIVFDELREAVANCAEGTDIAVVSQASVENFEPATLPQNLVSETACALLQHSSGTTGMKKGVALTYASIVCQLESYAASLGLSASKKHVIATWLPLYHDMGLLSSFLLPTFLGIPIMSLDPFGWIASPRSLLDVVDRHRVTHVWLPNFALMVMAQKVRSTTSWDMHCLEAVTCCSEPCKPASFDIFLTRFVPMGLRPEALKTCYAMAETVFAVTQSSINSPPRRLSVSSTALAHGRVADPVSTDDSTILLSNGRPIKGCDIRIADASASGGKAVGEILVRSDFMFQAYYRNPDATSAAWREGWYRTGDLGFLDDDELFIVGRLKDVIILNGRNIFAHDVEAAVSAVPGIKPGRCVAFGVFEQKVGSEQLIVVAEQTAPEEAHSELSRAINEAVLKECRAQCSDIRIVPSNWLVKTSSGKVSRSENVSRYIKQWGSLPVRFL